MTYRDAVRIGGEYLLPVISDLYRLEGYEINHLDRDYTARNVVYNCTKEGAESKILRVSFMNDRSRENYQAEAEYIRYLHENGGSVANVISSRNGNLTEEIFYNKQTFFICMFEKAKGKMFVDNGYRYREGVPITEYFYNCGKTLGKLHQLSKKYTPVHRRYSFFDKFNADYLDKLLPDSLPLLKEKINQLLKTLESVDASSESFGMIHFDFNDGNYSIDFDTGQITVYDFDNSLFGWYMYDLADLWVSGTGWIQAEQNEDKRKKFMDEYFGAVLEGYRSETEIKDSMLNKLPLFLNATLLEGIVDIFEEMRENGDASEYDEDLTHRIKCMEEDIPYRGFYIIR